MYLVGHGVIEQGGMGELDVSKKRRLDEKRREEREDQKATGDAFTTSKSSLSRTRVLLLRAVDVHARVLTCAGKRLCFTLVLCLCENAPNE